jgi:hypothetical protein
MSTMNDTLDQQYQQLKFETSQISLNLTDDKLWTDQGINENLVEKIRSYIENGIKKENSFRKFSVFYI